MEKSDNITDVINDNEPMPANKIHSCTSWFKSRIKFIQQNSIFWISVGIVLIAILTMMFMLGWIDEKVQKSFASENIVITIPDADGGTSTKTIDRGNTTKVLIVVGAIAISIYILGIIKEVFYKKMDQTKTKKAKQKHTQWSKQSTVHVIKARIESAVKNAYEDACRRKKLRQMDEKQRHRIALDRASKHVKDSYKGVDIISQCQLESITYRSQVMSTLFAIRNHYLWMLFIHIVVIMHVWLSFYESAHVRTNDKWTIFGRDVFVGIDLSIMPLSALPEFGLLCIEFFDVIIRIFWIKMCPTHILRPKSEKFYAYLNLLALVYIAFDLILALCIHKSLEYLVPIRPILLILMNHTLRREVTALIQSIWAIVPVLKMYGLVVLFVGILGFVLFGDTVKTVKISLTSFIHFGFMQLSKL